MPRARPIGGIGLPRIGDAPEIVVEIIPSSEAPGGVSGLGTTALAPAVANAIYAGTGKRMRSPAVRSYGGVMTRPPITPQCPNRRSACC